MPGSLVTDTLDLVLIDATVQEDVTGTAKSTDGLILGGLYRAEATVGTAADDADTIEIEIQGCDSSDFSSTDVYPYGRFGVITGKDDNSRFFLDFVPQHKYIRAVVDLTEAAAGSFVLKVIVRECKYRRHVTNSAGPVS